MEKARKKRGKGKQVNPVTEFPSTLRSPIAFDSLEKDAEKKRINKEIGSEKKKKQKGLNRL